MRCLNCGKKIPRNAKICQFCEATVEPGPSKEEESLVRNLMDQLPPGSLEELRAAIERGDTAEQFADRVFVGDCPKCGGEETGNCEADPEIGELLVGRCYQCGQLWCTECGRLLQRDATSCECWEEDE
jgi:hypothetical protein